VLDLAPFGSEFDQKRIVDNESVLVLGLNAWIASDVLNADSPSGIDA